jgi:glycerol-1-phosphate dehydrogenase [NAD(P)+]
MRFPEIVGGDEMYKTPKIESDAGIARSLADLPGRVLVTTMEIPWALFQEQCEWAPDQTCMVENMDLATLETLDATLPQFDVIVGLGGGSCCDTAKYLAWKRGVRMVLAPTIVSVDAPLTNMVAVREGHAVRYVGDIFPEEVLVDYDLIRRAAPELNRAGAADIASIHTALFDWWLAHEAADEPYDVDVAWLAKRCLDELDRNASEVYNVTPKGIDTIIDLYRREVEFCARINTSRPEEGSEHLVAYNLEHLTQRHFVHGDLVALGIFFMTRLQNNRHDWAVDLMDRLGLRYRVPGVTRQEMERCLVTLKDFVKEKKLFFSCVDTHILDAAYVGEALDALFGNDGS